jgi:hypothetical protein
MSGLQDLLVWVAIGACAVGFILIALSYCIGRGSK